MTTKPQPRIDYTSIDYESLRSAMLELARERLPEWTDHSPNDLGVTLLELFASMGDSLFYYMDRVANESYLYTAQERRSVVNLLRLIGYELRPPMPANANLTLLFQDTAVSKVVVIPTGASFATNAKATGTPIGFQFLRLPISVDLLKLPKQTVAGTVYRRYVLPVIQVDQFVTNEVLGSSDESARQRFALAQKPLIDGTLTLTVLQPGQPAKVWRRVESLLQSGPQDAHYSVRRNEHDVAFVEFGDGIRARPPVRGRNNLLASYAVGGGAKGNVPAGSITDIKLAIDSLKKVYNEQAGNGGVDRETIPEAVERAPRQSRSMGRAVTASDFEAHARSFGVAKARVEVQGTLVKLYIAPAGGGYSNDLLKDDLLAYLNERRMLTTRVDLRDPTYVTIKIAAVVEVEPYFYRDEVKARVERAVGELLSFDRVDFGDTVYISKVYEAIEAIEGVAGVEVTFFGVGDESSSQGSIKLKFGEIPRFVGFLGDDLKVNGGK